VTIRQARQTIGKTRILVDTKSRESRRTLALPAFVVRKLQSHKVYQAERRLAAGKDWQQSDFIFTTRTDRPMDSTLVTRDLRRTSDAYRQLPRAASFAGEYPAGLWRAAARRQRAARLLRYPAHVRDVSPWDS